MKDEKKLKVCRVMASVNPTPHPNAKHRWLSSGHVPLHGCLSFSNYLNVLVNGVLLKRDAGVNTKLREMIRKETGLEEGE